MHRRTFLTASTAALALPAIAQAQNKRVLRFIPQSDLAVVDPIWTTAYVTRNHGFMVFDTLYGQTGQAGGFKATPQMVAATSWKTTARPGNLPCAMAWCSTTARKCWRGTASLPSSDGARVMRSARH